MVDLYARDVVVRTSSILSKTRINRHEMSSISMEWSADPTLHSKVEAVDSEGDSDVALPRLIVWARYQIDQSLLDSLTSVAHGVSGSEPAFFPFGDYTPALQEFVVRVGAEQRAILRRLIELIRWRTAHAEWAGTHVRSNDQLQEWSPNEITWHPLHVGATLRFTVPRNGPVLTTDLEGSIGALLRDGSHEPLGWEVWYSALAARDRNDARTAVNIGSKLS